MNTLWIAALMVLGSDDAPKKPLAGPPAVLVLKVKGRVEAEGWVGRYPVESGDFLLPGQVVSVAPGAEAVALFLLKRERRRFKPGSRATLTRDGCVPADAVERLGPAKLPRKNLTKVREIEVREGGGVGVVRGPHEGPRITPMLGTFVATNRPTFTWPPVDKAEEYIVELKTDGGGRNWKVTTKEAKLTYPEKEKPLTFEKGYVWSVKARLPGGDEKVVVEDSRFTLLFEDELKEMPPLRKLAASDDPSELLLVAAAFEGYRLYDDALTVFEKLGRLEPRAARWQLALYHYYRRAGRPDRAKEAREKAKKLGAAVKKP